MDLTGQTLGKYKLIRRLGKGGMAQVYLANQPTIERMVAVKVLHSHLAESDDFVARFKREARGLGQLQHPHIVQVIDFDTANELYYMVMDYIPGKTLRDYLDEKGKLSNRESLALVAQLTNALAYAHQKGMIHRDIKPANVMFSNDSCIHAILTDFGITRLLNEKSITVTGAMVGTPAYMSPEAVLGEDIDDRSDIYSLGVILFEMISGRTPYEGNTPLSLVIKQVHEPLPSPLEITPDLPLGIVAIIEKSLAKSADDRYQSADEFMEAVEAAQVAMGERPFGATLLSTTRKIQSEAETIVPEAETVVPEKETAVKPTPPTSSSRWPIYAGLGVLALIIIAGLIWLGQRDPSDNDVVANLPTATNAPVETAASEATAVDATATIAAELVIEPTQTIEAVVEEATAVSTDTPTPIPPTPTVAPFPLVVLEQMGTLRFVSSELPIANTFILQLDRVLQPPMGSHYALWFETADGLLNGGVLLVENGRIRATETVNENLVSLIQQVVVSLEPDSNPANASELVGSVVYVGELTPDYTAVLQQLLSDDGLLLNAQAQAKIARQH
ncbi:MAG: serine/threonine protein kinase, partial [Chloroflexi bacterium]|nr:serine/threonine protein kinase [Chloroflexota bacterium]